MVKRVQRVRHDPATSAAFVGKVGEITVETGTEQLRLHDGVTAGGRIIPSKTYVDAQDTATAALAIPKTIIDAADDIIRGSGADTPVKLTVGASTILAKLAAGALKAATPAEIRTLLNISESDAFITAIAALGTAGQKLIKTTGVDTAAEIAITTFGESLIDDANAAAARTTLGLGALAVLATVGSAEIDTDAVGTAELAALAVTAAELSANAVTTAKILNDNVTTAKIADNAITLAKFAHGTADAFLGFDGSGVPAEVTPSTIIKGTDVVKNPWATPSATTQAHDLGAIPDFIKIVLENLTAQQDYVAGDKLFMGQGQIGAAAETAMSFFVDATNVVMLLGDGPNIWRKDGASSFDITDASWKVTATPYLLTP